MSHGPLKRTLRATGTGNGLEVVPVSPPARLKSAGEDTGDTIESGAWMWPSFLGFAPLAALLGLAAAIDWRSRRLPNWLTLALAACGVAQSFAPWGTVHPTSAMTGFLAGMGLTIILFAIGALGGGDVKLLAAVGTWIGPLPVLWVFLAAAIIGMFIVLGQCAMARQLPSLFRNSALIAINLIHVRELGIDHVSRTGKAVKSVGRPLPYAVPVLLATLGLILYQKGVWR